MIRVASIFLVAILAAWWLTSFMVDQSSSPISIVPDRATAPPIDYTGGGFFVLKCADGMELVMRRGGQLACAKDFREPL